jgi:tetratricopeptide (TPR) repeat protein
MYFYRGFAKSKLEDYRGAILDYNTAIELNPKSAEVYFQRGLAKLGLKDINGACLDFSRAGELGDDRAYEVIKKVCN